MATAWVGLKERGLDLAKPSALAASGKIDKYGIVKQEKYTDLYVTEIRNGILACKYFLVFPFYFVCRTQTFNNLVAQAAEMKLGGTPNDLMQSLEVIFMLTFIPILDLLIYPLLRKWKITFNPVMRVFLGFLVEAASMGWACVLQYYIYKNPEASINVWIRAPAYVLGALENLKTFVSSIFWVTIAVGALIGIGLSPVSKDPNMVWVYGALTITSFVSGLVFYFCFRNSIKGNVPITVGQEVICAEASSGEGYDQDEKSVCPSGQEPDVVRITGQVPS